MQHAAVRARGLVKRFGTIEAVRGIDLEIAAGDVFGFLGPTAPASPPRSACCARC